MPANLDPVDIEWNLVDDTFSLTESTASQGGDLAGDVVGKKWTYFWRSIISFLEINHID